MKLSVTRTAIFAAVASLALAACGSSGSNSSSGTPTTANTPTASTPASTPASPQGSSSPKANASPVGTLTMVEGNQYSISQWGADVAQELGMWPDGLKVNISVSEKGTEILAAGKADIAVASPARFIGAIHQGLDASIVGATMPGIPLYVAVAPNNPAEKITDLKKGIRIGISAFGSTGQYVAAMIAKKQGWSSNDYKLVVLGNLQGLEAGLKKGVIDTFFWSSIPVYTMQKEGDAKVIGNAADIVGPSINNVIVVLNSTIEKNPAAVRAFCDGFYAANKKTVEDTDLAKQLLAKWGTKADVIPIAIDTQLPDISTNPEITDAQIDGMADATRFTVSTAKDVTNDEVKKMYRSCDTIG